MHNTGGGISWHDKLITAMDTKSRKFKPPPPQTKILATPLEQIRGSQELMSQFLTASHQRALFAKIGDRVSVLSSQSTSFDVFVTTLRNCSSTDFSIVWQRISWRSWRTRWMHRVDRWSVARSPNYRAMHPPSDSSVYQVVIVQLTQMFSVNSFRR